MNIALLGSGSDDYWVLTQVVVPIFVGIIGGAIGAASYRAWAPYSQTLWDKNVDTCCALLERASHVVHNCYGVLNCEYETKRRDEHRESLSKAMVSFSSVRGQLFAVGSDRLLELSFLFAQEASQIGHRYDGGGIAQHDTELKKQLEDAHARMINEIRSHLQVDELSHATRKFLRDELVRSE